MRFGEFRFIAGDGLWRHGRPVPLPPRAVGVLAALLASPNTVVAKQELMDAVWPGTFVTESSLLEAVGLLRDALGDDPRRPRYIQTVHRRGYRFIARLEDETTPPFFSGPEWRPIVMASAAYAITTLCVAIVFALLGQRLPERRTSRLSIALPREAVIDPLHGSVALSADGSQLAYVATAGGRSRLFLRSIDRDEPAPIAGTDDASDPFFSPDGTWIGFFARGAVQQVRLDGGAPITLAAARAGGGAAWQADGTIVFGGGPGGGLARISAASSARPNGGAAIEPVVLAAPQPGSRDLRLGWPDVLPGDRGVLYTAITLSGSDVGVLDLRTGVRTTLARQAAFARYSPTGHVVFERRGRLEAARFSLDTLRLLDTPRPIVSGVSRSGLLEGPRFSFSKSGALVYMPATTAERELDLWEGDLFPADPWLSTGGGEGISPAWRPNGLEIAFAFSKAGPFNLFMKPADGSGGAAPLLASPWNQFPTSWAPDASRLAFTEFQPLTGADIWVLDLRTRARHALVQTLFDETWARFSPDGRWITYMANETGRWEVYVRAIGSTARVRVSSGGGVWPCWSLDGRTVYYSAGGRTMASAVHVDPVLAAAPSIEVPGADAVLLAGGGTPGDRLLVRQAGAAPERRAELRVVLEWFAELARYGRPS